MRRPLILIPLLVLSACSGENSGWNPNYRAEATPYGDYLRQREAALVGRRPEPPQVIPVALPAKAPTAAEIAGPSPVRILERELGVAMPGQGARAGTGGAIHPVATLPQVPVTETGPYPGSTPVLVQYAFSARHAPGTTLWPRTDPRAASSLCAGYSSPAAAQTAFLAKGGPALDPAGMDPDGDGFVCGWDPAPYRADRL